MALAPCSTSTGARFIRRPHASAAAAAEAAGAGRERTRAWVRGLTASRRHSKSRAMLGAKPKRLPPASAFAL